MVGRMTPREINQLSISNNTDDDMHDYLLLTRPAMLLTPPSEEMQEFLAAAFHRSVREFKSLAERALPQIEWRTDFATRPDRATRIFSAPNRATAMEVSTFASLVIGVHADIVPLD